MYFFAYVAGPRKQALKSSTRESITKKDASHRDQRIIISERYFLFHRAAASTPRLEDFETSHRNQGRTPPRINPALQSQQIRTA
jgi:hypothetical protein